MFTRRHLARRADIKRRATTAAPSRPSVFYRPCAAISSSADARDPLLIVEENPIQTRKFLKDKMSSFTADQRAEYMSLWYEPATSTQDVLRAILMANSYSTHDSLAVFPKAARMNHGCAGASNVAYSWRKGEGKFCESFFVFVSLRSSSEASYSHRTTDLHALRGVKEGEVRRLLCYGEGQQQLNLLHMLGAALGLSRPKNVTHRTTVSPTASTNG